MPSSENLRSSSMVTWFLIFKKTSGKAKIRLPAKRAQQEANILMNGTLWLSRDQTMADPAD